MTNKGKKGYNYIKEKEREIKKMKKVIVVICILVAILVSFIIIGIGKNSVTEIESYVVKMEIIEKDSWSLLGGQTGDFLINARNENDAFVKLVSEEVYAKYAVGDIVFVKIQIMEDKFGNYEKYYDVIELVDIKNINEKEE